MDRFANLVHKPILNKTNEVVNCLHPRIIVNPLLGDLIYKYGNYTFDGKCHHFDSVHSRTYSTYFPKTFFRTKDLTLDDLSRGYVTNEETGEVFPMFLAVPCGHCDICKQSKQDAFAHRCELETQCYNHLPYFVTLTYRDEDLHSDGLHVEDAQAFLKRLRARLDYAGFNDRFRYVIVGEYGHRSHRQHLHCLIWNLYPTRDIKFFQIRKMIHQSWSHGFTYLSIVSPTYIVRGTRHGFSKPENCFKYVAKYIAKESDVPPGMNKCFCNTSRRHGGIGAPFLDRHAPYIRQHLSKDYLYKDVFTGKVKSIVYCRYNLSRLFPSFCQSVPLELRNAVRTLCKFEPFIKRADCYMDILQEHFKHLFWPRHFLTDLGRSPELQEMFEKFESAPASCNLGMHEVWSLIQVLVKYKDFDFDKSVDLSIKRNLIVSKLFEHKKPVFLIPRSSQIRKYRDLALQRECF